VHLRQVKNNVCLLSVAKVDQFGADLSVIEKSELTLTHFDLLADTRILADIVIIAETALVDDLINHFTTFATKNLGIDVDMIIGTIFAAMITMGFGGGVRLCLQHTSFF
jgi:hypothetical protein